MASITKVKIEDKLSSFTEHWTPKIVSELNGQFVKLAKVKGDFVWHKHDDEDELFFVISGTLFIELEDDTLELNAGELVVIPRGVDHRPYAPEEAHIMLFEPATTLNTGDTEGDLTVRDLEKI